MIPITAPWVRGCTCPVIEYSSGAMNAIVRRECPKHGSLFPPPRLSEREKYERAFEEAAVKQPQVQL